MSECVGGLRRRFKGDEDEVIVPARQRLCDPLKRPKRETRDHES